MARRRDEILRVAAIRFAAQGFHGVSIDEIGGDLGITGPALYHHFPSKDAILAELLVGISQRLLSEGSRRVDASVSAADALDELIGWHVEFAIENPELIVIQARDLSCLADTDQSVVKKLQRKYVALWTDAIVGSTEVDRATAEASAHAAFGLLNSTPHSARLPRSKMRALLYQMCVGAIFTMQVPAEQHQLPT